MFELCLDYQLNPIIHLSMISFTDRANGNKYIDISTISTYQQYQPIHNIITDGVNDSRYI